MAGSPQEFLHNQTGVDKQDEGFVQSFEVDVKNLAKFEHVFVSVWAVNQVKLASKTKKNDVIFLNCLFK